MAKRQHTYQWLLRHPNYGGRGYWHLLRAAHARDEAMRQEATG